MSQPRRPRRSAERDDWVPPPWNQPAADERPLMQRRPLYETPPPQPAIQPAPRQVRPLDSGLMLGMAVAPGVVGFLALAVSFLPFLTGGGSVPRGLLLLLVVQAAVVVLLKAGEYGDLTRIWFSTLICTAVLLPLLALQVTLLREPYVSWGRDSAAPALVATLVVAMVLLVGAVWSVSVGWAEPDQAGLIFMPQAMVVPALIGMRSTILEGPALRIFGQVLLLSAVAIAATWLAPFTLRLLTPPIAIAVEFLLLWATGYGPWFHATSGNVVRVLYSVMLAITVVLVVAVPFIALWVKHDAIAVRQKRQRGARPKPAPPQPARGPMAPRGR